MTNRLRDIEALGQAVWIDNINRELLDEGILRRLVDEDGISGVTSNPTIFEKAMGHSERYDEAFKELTASGISVNVTLLFDVRRYVEIAEAYVRGLERRAQAGEPVDRIASVASFFVSRVDSKV